MKRTKLIAYFNDIINNDLCDVTDEDIKASIEAAGSAYDYIAGGSINSMIYYEDTTQIYNKYIGSDTDMDKYEKNELVWHKMAAYLEYLYF